MTIFNINGLSAAQAEAVRAVQRRTYTETKVDCTAQVLGAVASGATAHFARQYLTRFVVAAATETAVGLAVVEGTAGAVALTAVAPVVAGMAVGAAVYYGARKLLKVAVIDHNEAVNLVPEIKNGTVTIVETEAELDQAKETAQVTLFPASRKALDAMKARRAAEQAPQAEQAAAKAA